MGSLPSVSNVDASNITFDEDNTLIFSEEVPLIFSLAHRSISDANENWHSWFRLEAKMPINNRINSGDNLIVSEWPYSSGWYQVGVFKRPNRTNNVVALETDSSSATQDIINKIEEYPFDIWERGNYLTAGLSLSRDSKILRNSAISGRYVIGVCEDARKAYFQLLQDKEVVGFLEYVRSGVIYVGPNDIKVGLSDETLLQCDELLDLSINQALAGPKDDYTSKWLGKPVSLFVKDIFLSHIKRFDRKYKGERSVVMTIDRDSDNFSTKDEEAIRNAIGKIINRHG